MNKDQQFQNQIKQTLDRQSVNPETENALRKARQAALAQAPDGGMPRWLPATAVACLLMIVVGVLVTGGDHPDALPPITADELAVIASEDELELLEELEFYIWFEEDKNA